ncbi:MAG: repeat protein, partial [Acidobacteriaceae bacterium]|nr:repeat protein [Acidobacteriaceae bacterium]
MKIFRVAACTLALTLILGVLNVSSDTTAKKTLGQNQTAGASENAVRLNSIGVAYLGRQEFKKAAQFFEKSIAADPRFFAAEVNRGIALLNLQDVEVARSVLQLATNRNPQDPFAWYNLGLLYRSIGEYEPALDAFRRVLQIDPEDPDTLYFIGSCQLQLKHQAEAIDALNYALKLNPNHASAEYALSRAYQLAGDMTRARQHLSTFQQLTKSKLGEAISTAYGEQGKYSKAEEPFPVATIVPAAIRVHFAEVGQESGLPLSSSAPNEKGALQNISDYLGSGACFLDYDGDGKPDLLTLNGSKSGNLALFRNLGNGRFADVTKEAGLDPELHALGCAAGDYDNDGRIDLAISGVAGVILLHNEKDGKFRDVTKEAGIRSGSTLGMTFIDYDHDGDLDLYTNNFQDFPREGANPLELPRDAKSVSSHMWRNNGNGTFTDVTEAVGLGVAVPSIAAIGTDYNNDRATDLLVTQWGRTPIIFQNPREGKFTEVNAWHGTMPATAAGVAVFDFNKDGWMDVAFTHWGAPGLTLWRNVGGKSFEQVSLPKMNWVRCWGVTAFDYDNDGWIDLAAVGETADGRGEIRLFRNMGSKGFQDVSGEVGLSAVQLRGPRALIAVDYDGDGATDLLVTQNHGPMKLLRNQGGNKNKYLRIALRGLADNKSGIGTKVEVFAGATRQKWEVQATSGYLGQGTSEIIAGLGTATEADVVRVLWPTGVLQDEIQLASGREQVVSEIDRRGSSCPTLFAWDGKRYRLIGDMIGAGVIGHWVGAGERNVPRPTEYIKVPGDLVQQRNGRLSFRLMEPMEEVVYLDQVKLMAIDHPRDVDVYPNEYFASNPPFPAFKVIASRNARPPAGAWDENKRDLLPELKAVHYISGFEVLPFKGFTKLHSLELDMGEPYQGGSLRLLLHGLIEYFTATGMYAADQAGIHAISPYVEAMDAKGRWVRVIDDMGFPAGLARTMVADLSGRLPVG